MVIHPEGVTQDSSCGEIDRGIVVGTDLCPSDLVDLDGMLWTVGCSTAFGVPEKIGLLTPGCACSDPGL